MSNLLKLTYNIEDIALVSKQVLEHATSKTLLFYGDMGVGKTTLIKALVKALGSTDDVQSPTYAIVNQYQGITGSIYHFDLYRIEEIEDEFMLYKQCRQMEKLIDELAKGRKMEKILRS